MMETQIVDWLNLLLRWAHVIAGIGWIGSSFYFVWLDGSFAKLAEPKKHVEGESWMVHGGSFYRTEKISFAPEIKPPHLHWFYWEAAFTWLTGVALLVVVYYLGSGSFLIDPAVMDIGRDEAASIGIATIVVAWLAYDAFWITPLAKRGGWLPQVISLVAVVGLAYGLCHVLSGRAAYIHIGAVLGTVMVGNVWVRIIPAQRGILAAMKAGKEPDMGPAFRARQRSLHNSYITLPVIFIMFSNHYPFTYAHPYNWLLLIGIAVVGAGLRHWMIQYERGRNLKWIPVGAALLILPIAWFAANPPGAQAITAEGEKVSFAEVQAVIAQRCQSCHALRPTDDTMQQAPQGVMFDRPDQIRLAAQRIRGQAVLTQAMPLGNKTEMKPEERVLLGRWIAQGAKID